MQATVRYSSKGSTGRGRSSVQGPGTLKLRVADKGKDCNCKDNVKKGVLRSNEAICAEQKRFCAEVVGIEEKNFL